MGPSKSQFTDPIYQSINDLFYVCSHQGDIRHIFFLNNKSINKIKEYRSSLKTCHKINRDFQFNIQSMIYFMSVHIKVILDKNVFV